MRHKNMYRQASVLVISAFMATAAGTGRTFADNFIQSGFFAGLSVGAGVFLIEADSVDAGTGDTTDVNGAGGEGVLADIFVGYDHITPSGFLVGAQIEGTLSDIDQRGRSFDGATGAVTKSTLGPDEQLSLLARLGGFINESTAVYGILGYTHAAFDLNFTTTGTSTTGGVKDFNSDGITIGGGVETAVAENTSIRFEYRFTEFDSTKFTDPATGDTVRYDPSQHIARFAVVFRPTGLFGGN